MSDEVKIPINLPGAAQAAADAGKVAAGLQGIGKAAEGAKKSTDENAKAAAGLGEELGNLGRRNAAAKDVIEGIDSASRGGAGGLFGLAKAAKNLWEIFAASSPLGRVVQLAAVAGAGFLALREKLIGAGESVKEIENNFGRAEGALQTLNKVKLDALKTEIDSVADRAKAFDELGTRLDGIKGRLLTAKLNVALAEIEADQSLNPEEKKQRTFSAREQFAKDKAALEDEARNRRVDSADNRSKEADAAANAAEATAARQRGIVEASRRSPADLAIVGKELAKQIADIIAERARLSSSGDPGNITKSESLAADQGALYNSLQYIRARQAAGQTEASKSAGSEQQQQLKALETEALRARKAADDAQRDFVTVGGGAASEQVAVAKERGLEARARRIAAGRPEPVSAVGMETVENFDRKAPTVIDAASIRAAAGEEGRKTGAEIARAMQEAIRANNEELLNQVKAARR